jgi:hypothetical protein
MRDDLQSPFCASVPLCLCSFVPALRAPLCLQKPKSVNLPENTRVQGKNSVYLPENTRLFAPQSQENPIKSTLISTRATHRARLRKRATSRAGLMPKAFGHSHFEFDSCFVIRISSFRHLPSFFAQNREDCQPHLSLTHAIWQSSPSTPILAPFPIIPLKIPHSRTITCPFPHLPKLLA